MQHLPPTLQHYQRFDGGFPIWYYVLKYDPAHWEVYVGAWGASSGRANLLTFQPLLQDQTLANKIQYIHTSYQALAEHLHSNKKKSAI
ncbi:MAG: hypothetical protein Q4B28_06985 [bacterium]|nr:hypothetical protein [bacterium]